MGDFKYDVSNYPRYHGGDEPESSFEAVMTCIKNFAVEERSKIIVLVTDASAHSPKLTKKGKYEYSDLIASANKNDITLFVVSPIETYYTALAESTGGTFCKITENERFVEIIDELAAEISLLAVR